MAKCNQLTPLPCKELMSANVLLSGTAPLMGRANCTFIHA